MRLWLKVALVVIFSMVLFIVRMTYVVTLKREEILTSTRRRIKFEKSCVLLQREQTHQSKNGHFILCLTAILLRMEKKKNQVQMQKLEKVMHLNPLRTQLEFWRDIESLHTRLSMELQSEQILFFARNKRTLAQGLCHLSIE
eukprot:s4636_g1.t1